HRWAGQGVTCTLASNNVLNPFTPFGDGSLIRMANLYANVCHAGSRSEMRQCFDMITTGAARALRLNDYGMEVGKPADCVILDCRSEEHTSELQSLTNLVCRLLLEKKNKTHYTHTTPVL